MKKLFTLLTLALISIGSAWGANQTDLITGITLPEIPSAKLDLATQDTYTADANGWIVVMSPKTNLTSSLTWYKGIGTNGGSDTYNIPNSLTAPYPTGSQTINRYTVQSGGRSHAIRFTGAEQASFLGNYNSDSRKTFVSLFSYSETVQSLVETKSVESGGMELVFSGLSTSTEYIAYIYGNASSNSDFYGFALKKHVDTYSVTYKANNGTSEADVVDASTSMIADCPAGFTAPAGKDFVEWNTAADGSGTAYAVGASVPSDLTLYAQWAGTYSVTYDLGSGSGTAPTQADVADGATFEVAAAPADLVAPAGKEFKCWNDGTTDYDAGATYTMGATNVTLTAVYQDKIYKGKTPTSTLDLSEATNSTFTTTWYTSNNMIKNCYYDAANGVVAFSPYAIYQNNPSWSVKDGSSSTSSTWETTGVFQGSSYYFSGSPKAATTKDSGNQYYYRVTKCTGVSALIGAKGTIEVYEVSAGVVTPDPVETIAASSTGTISITTLDKTKEYIIKVWGNQNSNVVFQEIAFYFPAVASVELNIQKEYTTYVTEYALDFSSQPKISAYVATSADGSVTLEEVEKVPAGTPLVLKASSGYYPGSFYVDVTASATAPTTNLLKGSATEKYTVANNGDAYVLSDGKFHPANAGDIPAGKAYLLKADVTEPTSSHELAISFGDGDVTGIKNMKVGTEDNVYYDLQGRRVLYPTKGLYIVNGKKVILK